MCGGQTVWRKCVYVCATIPPLFRDNYPGCVPQGASFKWHLTNSNHPQPLWQPLPTIYLLLGGLSGLLLMSGPAACSSLRLVFCSPGCCITLSLVMSITPACMRGLEALPASYTHANTPLGTWHGE